MSEARAPVKEMGRKTTVRRTDHAVRHRDQRAAEQLQPGMALLPRERGERGYQRKEDESDEEQEEVRGHAPKEGRTPGARREPLPPRHQAADKDDASVGEGDEQGGLPGGAEDARIALRGAVGPAQLAAAPDEVDGRQPETGQEEDQEPVQAGAVVGQPGEQGVKQQGDAACQTGSGKSEGQGPCGAAPQVRNDGEERHRPGGKEQIGVQTGESGQPGQQPPEVDLLVGEGNVGEQAVADGQQDVNGEGRAGQKQEGTRQGHFLVVFEAASKASRRARAR